MCDSTEGRPDAGRAPSTARRTKACRDRFEDIVKKEEDEKVLKEAAEAAARDAVHEEEARLHTQPETVSPPVAHEADPVSPAATVMLSGRCASTYNEGPRPRAEGRAPARVCHRPTTRWRTRLPRDQSRRQAPEDRAGAVEMQEATTSRTPR